MKAPQIQHVLVVRVIDGCTHLRCEACGCRKLAVATFELQVIEVGTTLMVNLCGDCRPKAAA